MKSRYNQCEGYLTKDGSLIRELMHPKVHGNHHQSLAEAVIEPGASTKLHLHRQSEELYHVLAGRGVMIRGVEQFVVEPGDTICIPPGTPHRIENDGATALRILCCCAPPYAHADTEMLSGE
jgi:mannose-6-phosphate isomerase-like protein (cupin superfamily)